MARKLDFVYIFILGRFITTRVEFVKEMVHSQSCLMPAPSNNFSSKNKKIYDACLHERFCLTLEDEAGADLVASLVELVGVERETNTEGGASVELGVVGEGSNTTVVDLGL